MDTSRDTRDLEYLDRIAVVEAALLEDPDNEFLWDELARLSPEDLAA